MFAIISIFLYAELMDQCEMLPYITRVCFALDGILAILVTYWKIACYWLTILRIKGMPTIPATLIAVLIA